MKIVAIADTHGINNITVPDGDVLIHAGDWSRRSNLKDVYEFRSWMNKLPHRHKVAIAGNHDKTAQYMPGLVKSVFLEAGCVYLQDESCEIGGVKFYGSPWTPTFLNWFFMKDRGADIAQKWSRIPDDTDVLITHGPSMGILDYVEGAGEPQGCADLKKRLLEVYPKAHIFGHIHEGYGVVHCSGIKHINASVNTANYQPINSPIVFEL